MSACDHELAREDNAFFGCQEPLGHEGPPRITWKGGPIGFEWNDGAVTRQEVPTDPEFRGTVWLRLADQVRPNSG